MVIIGIDPGLATTGYGVIDASNNKCNLIKAGAILTSKDSFFSERLQIIYQEMCSLIEEFNPDEIAIEELFFSKNTKTAIMVSHARGVLILACRSKGKPMFEYTPLQVKQGITGNGRADKSQIGRMIRHILSLDSAPKPDDAADALAIAVCHANQIKVLKNVNFGITEI